MLSKFKKQLRQSQTDAENILWYHLRNRHLNGLKFRRQHIIQGYIVDFVCLERKIVIEIDGGHHAELKQYDDERTKQLQAEGFMVYRFWNNEIFENLDSVLEFLHKNLNR